MVAHFQDILRAARLHAPSFLLQGGAAVLVAAVLVLISAQNYLLFHGITELASVAVALAIFLLVWNSRKIITDSFLLLIGISFLFTGGMDLLHTLAYKGMGVFPGNSADLPTQLWLAARYFQSITFFAAILLIGRTLSKDRKRDVLIFGVFCSAFAGLLLAAIFVWQSFPAAFVEGTGLTQFKIVSEYVISSILIATVAVLVLRRRYIDRQVWIFMIAAQLFLVAGELAFTSYASVYGPMNLLGHLFRLASVYFFYKAIVVAGLTRPYDLLFRELKQNEVALIRSEQQYRSLVEMSPDAIFVNRKNRIDYLNPSALRLFGAVSPDQVVGRSLSEVFHPASHVLMQDRIQALQAGSAAEIIDEQVVRLDGSVRDVEVAAFPFEDAGGPAIEVILHDITGRKEAERELTRKNIELVRLNDEISMAHEELTMAEEELRQSVGELTLRENSLNDILAEKEILLSEIHHRVKNNLTAFISLLSLDGTCEQTDSGRALRKDLQNRARSMALIHETLYRTRNFSRVDMGIYLTTLVDQIANSYAGTTTARVMVQADGVSLDIVRATPVGLIINELVTNSFKYAFPERFDCNAARGEPCTIRVSLALEDGLYTLSVKDNGVGLPSGIDPSATQSLGLKLVNFLARHQLQATVGMENLQGTEIRIIFRGMRE